MMNLGFVSAIVPELSFEEVISFAAANGFACVELMCWPKGKADRKYAGVTHIDPGELDTGAAARIKACLQEKRVAISALGYYPNPLDAALEKAEFYVAHLKRVIDAAALLGVGTVNTFIGRDPMTDLEANFKRFASVWPPIIAYAEGKGVRIAIENCPMCFTKDEWPAGKNLAFSPAVWRRMFATIPSKSFGLNYDPSHLLWQQIDYVRPIYEFKERIFHVHLKDGRGSRAEYRGEVLGDGELHLPHAIRAPMPRARPLTPSDAARSCSAQVRLRSRPSPAIRKSQ